MQMTVIKLWDLETGRCLQQMTGDHYYTNSINCIAPLPDGRRLVSATDNVFEVWECQRGCSAMPHSIDNKMSHQISVTIPTLAVHQYAS